MSLKKNLEYGYSFFEEVGKISYFSFNFFRESFKPGFELKELIKQCYAVGYKSFALVGITTFIIGLVFTVQSLPTLASMGAESMLPFMVSLALVREIAPVITGLICAGKVSSGIGAELGSMRITEQIDAMEVSGTNPFRYLVVTRIAATTLMLPVLASLAIAISLYGAFVGVNLHNDLSWNLFWTQVFEAVGFGDIIPAILKTFFFGFAIGLIGCYMGYREQKGTEDIGKSANSAVVISSLLIFVIDLIAVQIAEIWGLI